MTFSRRNVLRSLLTLPALSLSWLSTTRPAAAVRNKLPPLNQLAPDFTLPSSDSSSGAGQTSLRDYRGQWVVLYFYPKDFTSGCTLEAQRFQRDLAEYQHRHAQIVGISADDIKSHADFCESEGLRFPLLADTDGAVSKAYGSWLAPYSMRHTFLINPEGILMATFVAVRPAVHSGEVLAKLDELLA
jgi:thioredoxin-dependent peroxiredoxin